MATSISDYVRVDHRAAELGCSFPERIAVLPENFDTAATRADLRQRSEAATVRTLFRNSNIPTGKLLSDSERIPYVQNNAFEWVAPTLFIASAALIENPAAVSVALSVLANYLTDFFKGISGEKKIKLNIVVERKADRVCKKISYDGSIEGLKDLGSLVRQISDDHP